MRGPVSGVMLADPSMVSSVTVPANRQAAQATEQQQVAQATGDIDIPQVSADSQTSRVEIIERSFQKVGFSQQSVFRARVIDLLLDRNLANLLASFRTQRPKEAPS